MNNSKATTPRRVVPLKEEALSRILTIAEESEDIARACVLMPEEVIVLVLELRHLRARCRKQSAQLKRARKKVKQFGDDIDAVLAMPSIKTPDERAVHRAVEGEGHKLLPAPFKDFV